MSSWSCPHLDMQADWCRRLNAACVLGRKGCVLPRTLRFAKAPQARAGSSDGDTAPVTPPVPEPHEPG